MASRFRGWRLRTLLVAVALLAATMGAARMLLKPYPEIIVIEGGRMIFWSDGTSTWDSGQASPTTWHDYGPFVWVAWSDGTTTTHLRWSRH